MKPKTRILCFIPLFIFIGFGVWNYYYGWTPPEISPELFHSVNVDLLMIKHPFAYEIFYNLIINGRIIYMELINNQLQLYLQSIIPMRVNCCFTPEAFQYRIGDTVYFKGFAFIYLNTSLSLNSNISDGYFLATEGHNQTSYSLLLSIGGLLIILFVLVLSFKFKRDVSFERREGEFLA